MKKGGGENMKKKYQKPVVVVYKDAVEANAQCFHRRQCEPSGGHGKGYC